MSAESLRGPRSRSTATRRATLSLVMVSRHPGLAASPGSYPRVRWLRPDLLADGTRRSPLGRYVRGFEDIDGSQLALVGGKGAGLARLSRIDGIRVPAGFCVTTDAFARVLAE